MRVQGFRVTQRSRYPNNGVFGPSHHSVCSIWDLKPHVLGTYLDRGYGSLLGFGVKGHHSGECNGNELLFRALRDLKLSYPCQNTLFLAIGPFFRVT